MDLIIHFCSMSTPCSEFRWRAQHDLSPSSVDHFQYYCRFGLFSEDLFVKKFYFKKYRLFFLKNRGQIIYRVSWVAKKLSVEFFVVEILKFFGKILIFWKFWFFCVIFQIFWIFLGKILMFWKFWFFLPQIQHNPKSEKSPKKINIFKT